MSTSHSGVLRMWSFASGCWFFCLPIPAIRMFHVCVRYSHWSNSVFFDRIDRIRCLSRFFRPQLPLLLPRLLLLLSSCHRCFCGCCHDRCFLLLCSCLSSCSCVIWLVTAYVSVSVNVCVCLSYVSCCLFIAAIVTIFVKLSLLFSCSWRHSDRFHSCWFCLLRLCASVSFRACYLSNSIFTHWTFV